MPVPSREQLERWAERYVALWNAGDTVGTPEKRGFEPCCAAPFDLFQPKVRFRIQPGSLFICGNEVAWLLEMPQKQEGELGALFESYLPER